MTLSPKQLLRRSCTTFGCGLAVLAASVMAAEPAAAQRRSHGEVRLTANTRSGISINASIGRGYAGGHYETRSQRVWVPGRSHQVWVPAVYEWRHESRGHRRQVLTHAGYYRTEHSRGRYESRSHQVWVPAQRSHVSIRSYRDHGQRRNRVTHVGRRHR